MAESVSEAAKPRRRSKTGRLIVGMLYAAFMVYGFVAVLGSLVRQLYGGPPPSPEDTMSRREHAWCVSQMAGLRDDLEEHVAQA